MGQPKASIDIGSNSILLLVGSHSDEGKFEYIDSDQHVVGLGRGLSIEENFPNDVMLKTIKLSQ